MTRAVESQRDARQVDVVVVLLFWTVSRGYGDLTGVDDVGELAS